MLKPGGRLIASVDHPFATFLADREAGRKTDYFATYKWAEEWTVGGQTALMSFWARPLHAMTDAFTAAGFRITVISEPAFAPDTPASCSPPTSRTGGASCASCSSSWMPADRQASRWPIRGPGQFLCLRRGLRLKDGPGSARAATVSVWLRRGFILSPSARTGPSRLGPAGEGRSDGGVLHLHPRGQARYPEGGRRREDEPPGKGGAFAPIPGDVEHQGDEHLESGPGGGSRPRAPRVWLRSPRFFTPYRPTRTRQDLPCTSAGEPRTPWLACH